MRGGTERFLSGEGLLEQVADDRVLEAGDQVESLRVRGGESVFNGGFGGRVGTGEECFATGFGFRAQVVQLDIAKDSGFDSGKREEEARIEIGDGCRLGGLGARRLAAEVKLRFDLREGEGHGTRVAVLGERVDPGAAGVAEAEELGDFVVGFAGGVVDGAADERVVPRAVGGSGEIEMGVAAGDDESEGWLVGGGLVRGVLAKRIMLFALVKKTAWMWPSRWLTAMRGMFCA